MKKNHFFASLKILKKGIGSGSISQGYGRIGWSGSGSAPKCHGSPTLANIFISLVTFLLFSPCHSLTALFSLLSSSGSPFLIPSSDLRQHISYGTIKNNMYTFIRLQSPRCSVKSSLLSLNKQSRPWLPGRELNPGPALHQWTNKKNIRNITAVASSGGQKSITYLFVKIWFS